MGVGNPKAKKALDTVNPELKMLGIELGFFCMQSSHSKVSYDPVPII